MSLAEEGIVLEVIQVKKDENIAKQRDKVKAWYIIKEGSVIQKNAFVETKIGPNGIIGILEQDWFQCDYVAETDVTLFVFPCEGVQDLRRFLAGEPRMRKIFLHTAMIQRHHQICVYADLSRKVREFQTVLRDHYNEYQTVCAKYHIDVPLNHELEHFKPLEIQHKAENWELNQSNSLIHSYLEEYLELLIKDEHLCIGSIMEASAQMHRVTRGIGEMIDFLLYHREVLLGEDAHSLFQTFLTLGSTVRSMGGEAEPVWEKAEELLSFAAKIGIYEADFLAKCQEEYETALHSEPDESTGEDAEEKGADSDLEYIILYAGYGESESKEILTKLRSYQESIRQPNADETAYQLRKFATKLFYDIYLRCIFRAVQEDVKEGKAVPITILLFLNFGYMDVGFLGEEKTDSLYHLAHHMDLCHSDHVFTMYDWIKAVYTGEREPSKSEFDLDYQGMLLEEVKHGNLQKSQLEERQQDREAKVRYELDNMFQSVNRTTYGNITSFCPILREEDVAGAPERMLVTATKIFEAMDGLRKVDYSVFYRPILNHGLSDEMQHEALMGEILPDVILMPNPGTRAMMWQETASIRNDTPARFMIPILTPSDIDEVMLEIVGRYRWEMCRKIQGVHWNDIHDRSLTSEYYDYLQFYRKNNELSGDTKEQIKKSLSRSKNNFREVFVKDYQNYIKYEAKGGFRLNKYVRKIIFTYCPLSKNIREELKGNPMFSDVISKHEINMTRVLKRLRGLYDKYEKEGHEITAEMKENMDYYMM